MEHTQQVSLTRDPAGSLWFGLVWVGLVWFCFSTVTELGSGASIAAVLLGSPEPVRAAPSLCTA